MLVRTFRTGSILLLLFIYVGCQKSNDTTALEELVKREIPWMAGKVLFTVEDKHDENVKDRFSVTTKDGHISIFANSSVAAATGLNWYLKYYCHRTISHTGDNMDAVGQLPSIDNALAKRSAYRYRYALNYCTANYTMSFWDWPRWEKELDWMAMNGVNLLLAPLGNELVWYNVLRQLNIPDSSAIRYAPGPAFTAWWLMGNLEGWQGPLSMEYMQQQAELQKKILTRCKELGIDPVVQGFYGTVPTFLRNYYPRANYVEQGKWEGGFQRPELLDPADPLFEKIAALYYSEYRHLYGNDLKYFGGDPFHEGGATGGLNLQFSAEKIYNAAAKYYPDAVWVLQAWQGNPKPQLLHGFGNGNVLVLDLFGESDNYWEQRKGYEGYPWLWCVINNFGEKTGMWGKLQHFATEPVRALHTPYGSSLKGIGIMPEGINNNAVVYDLVLEMGWHDQPVDLQQWIRQYAFYRYGVNDEHIAKGWELLLRSVYSTSDSFNILGPVESVFLAKPSLNVQSVSTWGVTKIYYDPAILQQAANEFLAVADQYWNKTTFRYDVVDMCRQLLSARGKLKYDEMMNDYKEGSKNEFALYKERFLEMILQQDSLCSLHEGFTLERWLDEAKARGNNDKEDQQFVQNAKVQISFWGPVNPQSTLTDYANKQWSGMLRSYYYQRWVPFLDSLSERLEDKTYIQNREPLIDYYGMGLRWADDSTIYTTEPMVAQPVNWLKERVNAEY